MKLYKINFTHYAQRGNDSGIKEYVLAENGRQVFEYLSEGYAYWDMYLSNDRELLESVFKNKGDYHLGIRNGITRYSWEEVSYADNKNIESILLRYNIAKRICD